MQHIHETIAALRRYISASEKRDELEEIDTLLAVALSELQRKLNTQRRQASEEGK